ncbi:hypothetical protein VPHG_00043 [Vibrio phage 11895-B1]|uniref:hypothetical protein n=1 Tax=Vibrio phage 11895-B1 TaxID=754075 RepID=UPI0002C0D4AF|nr:hypothetical protein VPHG_00043 [Vibrio phage 11895-B1]AGH32110.1 hypothetical protein VPHG_00043 [Vibrio phage 11895-B1]
MFNLFSTKLNDHDRLEVETHIAILFSNHVKEFKSDNMLELGVKGVVDLANNLKRIPEGDTINVTTLNHGELEIKNNSGKLTVKQIQWD